MPIGPIVRKMFGPLEPWIAESYRKMFCNIPELATTITENIRPKRILELGCGEGALVSQISKILPESDIVGIDICEGVGRLFDGNIHKVHFYRTQIENYLKQNAKAFDAVLMCDVLHHIPEAERVKTLGMAKEFLGEAGVFVMKDWISSSSVIHLLSYISDRYITGDINVRYWNLGKLRQVLYLIYGANSIVAEKTIAPHMNNIVFFVIPSNNTKSAETPQNTSE